MLSDEAAALLRATCLAFVASIGLGFLVDESAPWAGLVNRPRWKRRLR
jgi:hypothetical protein